MTQLPAVMKAAHVSDLRTHHVPRIPEWWPLPPEDAGLVPPTEEERARARRIRQVQEATQGPVDGARYVVQLNPDGTPPETFAVGGAPGTRYRLSRAESTRRTLVYRYDVDCPDHQALMRAVEDGFTEYGRDYTMAAREDTDHDRTAPPEGAFTPRLAYPRG